MIRNILTWSNIIWTLIIVAVFCGLVAWERDSKFPFVNFTPPSEKYEILQHETDGDTEIYAILIRPGGKGEYAALSLQKNCKKSCAIDVYDDKNAFTQQKRYDAMTKSRSADQAEVDDWMSKNSGFVKEHYVGWLDEKTGHYYN